MALRNDPGPEEGAGPAVGGDQLHGQPAALAVRRIR